MKKLIFQDEQGKDTEFYVLEQTRISGRNYLLVTDSEEDGECLILKDMAGDQEKESVYEILEDGQELDGVLAVFDELLEDVDITR